MKQDRAHGEPRESGSSRSGKGAARTKRAVPEPGVSRCLSCLAPVNWYDDRDKGTWVPFDHGTKEIHRCPK